MESTHRTIKNVVYSISGNIWPIISALLITPIIVSSLGIKEYGIYTFFNTTISFMGLLDLGVATAVGKYLAEYHGRGDIVRIRALLATANSIFLGVGLVGLTIFVIGAFLPSIFTIFSGYSSYKIGLIAAGFLFLISSISSTYTLITSSLQRFDIGFKVGVTSLIVQQLTILILVLNGHSINSIFITLLCITFATLIAQILVTRKLLPNTPYKLGWNKEEAKKSYMFGLVTFANGMASVSLTYLDRLIMPFFLGPSSLTYYSLPGNVAMKIPGISNSFSAVLFPMASSLSGNGEIDRLKTLYIRSFRLITVVAAALTVIIISFARPLLTYWISPDLADHATNVLLVLTATNFLLALIGPLSNFLLGLGKLKLLTVTSIIMAISNTILLIILIPLFGIVGAAWAWLLSLGPAIYMFYFTEKHYLKLENRLSYYRNIISQNVLVAIIIFAISHFFAIQLIHNLISVVVISGCMGILYLVIYWMFGFFEKDDVESIKGSLKRMLKIS